MIFCTRPWLFSWRASLAEALAAERRRERDEVLRMVQLSEMPPPQSVSRTLDRLGLSHRPPQRCRTSLFRIFGRS